ncbi:MAG TPA: hypothetical protein PKD54_05650, partial [Pirellulaceae bacterium]|nr:hypothetical protein [Pirellulaceae bacterium]
MARVPAVLNRIIFGAVRFGMCCLIAAAFQSSWVSSDEIIIDGRLGEPVELGGISWSPKYGFSGSLLELQASSPGLVTGHSCELTAGELYAFFK